MTRRRNRKQKNKQMDKAACGNAGGLFFYACDVRNTLGVDKGNRVLVRGGRENAEKHKKTRKALFLAGLSGEAGI